MSRYFSFASAQDPARSCASRCGALSRSVTITTPPLLPVDAAVDAEPVAGRVPFLQRTVVRCLAVASVWRLLLAVWATIAHYVVKPCDCAQDSLLLSLHWPANPLTLALDAMYRGDAAYYVYIAHGGYEYSMEHYSSIGFYPLFPILIKALALPLGDPYIAGIIVSTLAFFAAIALLAVWLEDHGLARRAPLIVAVMLCFPFSLFFAAIYSEGLYLALTLGAVLAAERRRWLACSLCAGLVVLTRPTGVFVVICVGLIAWRARERGWRPLLPFAAAGVALGSFLVYQWLRFGTPMAYAHAKTVYGWEDTPQRAIQDLLLQPQPGRPSALLALMLLVGLLFLATVPIVYREFGPAYAAYCAFSVLGSFLSLPGMGRYVSVAFPSFAVVGASRRAKLVVGLVIFMVYFQAFAVALWVAGYAVT